MRRFFKWVFCIVSFIIAVGIVGIVVFISQFDLNTYKPQIEKLVYEHTGRKLSLNGDIGIKISLIPTVSLKDVALENASWAKEKNMVTINEADVSLALLPLLNKEIEIGEIRILEPVIHLAVNKDGAQNWVFEKSEEGTSEDQQKNEKQKEATNTAAAPLLVGFFASKIDIKDGTLQYSDKKSNAKTVVKINNLALKAIDDKDDIDLAYDVVVNNERIVGTATGDSINTFLKGVPYNVTADAKAYGLTLWAKAVLKDLMTNISFDADIKVLSPKGNFDLPRTEVVSKVSGTPEIINADIEKIDIGGNIISGKLKVNLSNKKPNITGTLKSALLDLTKLKETKKTASFEIFKTANAAAFIGNNKLDLSYLNTADANMNVSVQKLIINQDIILSNLKTNAVLSSGTLTLSPIEMVAGGGQINGTASINAKGNVLQIKMNGKNIIAQDFMTSLKPNDTSHFAFLSGGKTDFYLDLTTNGETYPKLVENLKGQLLFAVNESRLHAGNLKYLKGNFITQLLSTLNIQAKDPKMTLKCAVLRADFKDGKATFPKGIVFNSKKMMVVGDGNINLKNDKIDIAVKPFNGNLTDTNIAQALSSLIKIGGTVSNPAIAVDTASVVKNVVGVAMTGPAFLGSQLLLDADPAPCYTALKGTSFSNMFEAPKGVKAGAQNAYQNTSDVIDGGLNLITGAAGGVAQGGVDVLTGTAKGVLNLLTGKSDKEQKK